MIHTTPNSGKFRRLVHYLRPRLSSSSIAAETMAVGLLERVYHVAATETTGGEVGLLDDVVFAEMVGWLNEPGWLIAALLEADILTDDPACRYRVTDWDSIRRLYPPDIPIRRLDVTDAYWRRLRAAVISRRGRFASTAARTARTTRRSIM
jgi:hypothetical protein